MVIALSYAFTWKRRIQHAFKKNKRWCVEVYNHTEHYLPPRVHPIRCSPHACSKTHFVPFSQTNQNNNNFKNLNDPTTAKLNNKTKTTLNMYKPMIKFLGKRALLPNITPAQIKLHPWGDHLPGDISIINFKDSTSNSTRNNKISVPVLESLFELPVRFQRKEISDLEMGMINGGGIY